jgi:hypothetical protein
LTNGATRSGSPLAYSLDGTNDFISFGDVVDFTSGSMTLSMWVKRDNAATSAQVIIGKFGRSGGVATEDGWLLRFYLNKFEVVLIKNAVQYKWTSTSTYTDTASFHQYTVVLTSGSGEISVYQNGSAIAGSFTGIAFTLDDTAYELRVGNYVYVGIDYDHFSGSVDDILIWTTGLGSAEAGYLASQRGAIYALAAAGGGPINSQSLIRPADSKPYQQLIGV